MEAIPRDGKNIEGESKSARIRSDKLKMWM